MTHFFQLPEIYFREAPWGDLKILKTNYMINLYNFSTTSPISDIELFLDKSYKDLKLSLLGKPPRGNT